MRYKSLSHPSPSLGVVNTDKKIVVPNQALSLEDILQRFTRGEALPISLGDPQYHESDDDLEKLSHLDLVDKEEFSNRLEETKAKYDHQEKTRKKKAADKIAADALKQAKADLEAKKSDDSGGSAK